jgi:Predicted 3-hydroxylacyl-(acyl carrier protein) dehydratase
VDKYPLDQILPHRAPMILLTDYDADSFSPEGVVAEVTVGSGDVFFDHALGGVPNVAALEYMAQTVACYAGLKARSEGREPRIGYVLGSRNLTLSVPFFRSGATYRIRCSLLFFDDGFASFDCGILDASGAVVASAILSAYSP